MQQIMRSWRSWASGGRCLTRDRRSLERESVRRAEVLVALCGRLEGSEPSNRRGLPSSLWSGHAGPPMNGERLTAGRAVATWIGGLGDAHCLARIDRSIHTSDALIGKVAPVRQRTSGSAQTVSASFERMWMTTAERPRNGSRARKPDTSVYARGIALTWLKLRVRARPGHSSRCGAAATPCNGPIRSLGGYRAARLREVTSVDRLATTSSRMASNRSARLSHVCIRASA